MTLMLNCTYILFCKMKFQINRRYVFKAFQLRRPGFYYDLNV